MKKNYINKILATCLIATIILISFTTVCAIKKDIQISESQVYNNSFYITSGTPTQDGSWFLSILHNGQWNNRSYEGVWTFEVSTHVGMTAEEKAQAMRDEINNKQGCPLTASGTGIIINVIPDNGQIIKYSSLSDDGQSVHGTSSQMSAFCFIGTPSSGTVKVELGSFTASTTTDGKSLLQIHNDLFTLLQNNGFFVIMDSSGLAFLVIGAYTLVGIDSNDPWLSAMGEFLLNLSVEPFGIYVGMQEDVIGSSEDTLTLFFDFLNSRCISDTYKITATDEKGWVLDPIYDEQGFIAGQKKVRVFDITIPTGSYNTTNVVNITITSLTSPWINCSGYIKILVNNRPSITIIDGISNGNPGIDYQYNFTAIDPDSDDIFYYIDWGDGNNTGWLGPYSSGEKIVRNHIWSKKGIYLIKAVAKDVNGLQGSYGTLTVTIPRTVSKNSMLNIILERFSDLFFYKFFLFRSLIHQSFIIF